MFRIKKCACLTIERDLNQKKDGKEAAIDMPGFHFIGILT